MISTDYGSDFYAWVSRLEQQLPRVFRSFKLPVHVDLQQCKLIQNVRHDGDTCWGVFPTFEAAWVQLRTEKAG